MLQHAGILIAMIAILTGVVRYRILAAEYDRKLANVVTEVARVPLDQARSKFAELSAFDPEGCIEEIRKNYQLLDGDNTRRERLSYAVVLSPNIPGDNSIFEDSLINAERHEIATIVDFAEEIRDSNETPYLTDERIQELTREVEGAPFISGVEHVWDAPTNKLIAKFRNHEGKINQRYAWSLKIQLEDFKALCSELREHQYRPVCVRIWTNAQNTQFVSAIWHRSSADWKVTYDITPAELKRRLANESMHLVDVSSTRSLKSNSPTRLTAVWSSQENPYGEARLRLLAGQIPELANSVFREKRENSKCCVIPRDIAPVYLHNTPFLVDVLIHGKERFKPTAEREQNKIKLGSMIADSLQFDDRQASDSPEYKKWQHAALKIQADAHFKLEQFDRSTTKFKDHIDAENAEWEELLIHTLACTRSGDIVHANHWKATLQRKMVNIVLSKGRVNMNVYVAKAIDLALRAEVNFKETGDPTEYIKWLNERLEKIDSKKHVRLKNDIAAEYFVLALTTHFVFQTLDASSDSEYLEETRTLRILRDQLVESSAATKPRQGRLLWNWYHRLSTINSPFANSYLYDQEISVRSSAWSNLLSDYESMFIEPRYDKSHLAKHRWLDEDYFPTSIVMGTHNGVGPKKGSIWHREVKTPDLDRKAQRLANLFSFALRHGHDIGAWRILGSEGESVLKDKLINTIFLMKVDPATLIEKLDRSENSNERVSILRILEQYSIHSLEASMSNGVLKSIYQLEASKRMSMLSLLRQFTCELDDRNLFENVVETTSNLTALVSDKELELCSVVKNNLKSTEMASSTLRE